MSSQRTRLDKLETTWHRRPPGCYAEGPACTRYRVVGDGSDDPVLPPLPTVCPDCGRPACWRVVVVAGVDVDAV